MGASRLETFSGEARAALAALSESDRVGLEGFVEMEPDLGGQDADENAQRLVGLTCSVGATLKRALPGNEAVSLAVDQLVAQLVRERTAIFLPPNPPPSLPGSGERRIWCIIIPPDKGGGQRVCGECGRPL